MQRQVENATRKNPCRSKRVYDPFARNTETRIMAHPLDECAAALDWDEEPREPRARCIQALRDGKSYIYFIAGADTPVKIGKSISPYERLSVLQTAHWSVLELLLKIEGGYLLEKELHRRFASDLIQGEWFRRSDELEAFIASGRLTYGIPAPYHVPMYDPGARGRTPRPRRFTPPRSDT